LKLCELDEDWAWLRKKIVTLDEEISELETEVTQAGCEKISMMGVSLANPTTALEGVVVLLPWLQLHLTK